MSAFGFVVDDDGPDKAAAGGAAKFAHDLADGAPDPGHLERCPSCQVAGEAYACVGLVPAPLSAEAERWLVEHLPEDIESLPGFLLRKAISEYGHSGEAGARLRREGLLAAPGPFTRHFGPFFRRFTISSEQLVEELLCVGDVAPPHALAVLVHLGLITVDGEVPAAMERGQALGELVADVESRRARTAFVDERAGASGDSDAPDDPSLAGLRRYLRALHAAFVVDATVRLFPPAEG